MFWDLDRQIKIYENSVIDYLPVDDYSHRLNVRADVGGYIQNARALAGTEKIKQLLFTMALTKCCLPIIKVRDLRYHLSSTT